MKIFEFVNKPSGIYGLGGIALEPQDLLLIEDDNYNIDLGQDINDALFGANSPSESNPFLTLLDRYGIGAGLSLDLDNNIQFGNDGAGVLDISDTDVFSNKFLLKYLDTNESNSLEFRNDFYAFFTKNEDDIRQEVDFSMTDHNKFELFTRTRDLTSSVRSVVVITGNSGTDDFDDSRIEISRTIFDTSEKIQSLRFLTDDFGENYRIILRDDINSKGIEYFGDYEPNFTNRSLVTKFYVDNEISNIDFSLYIPYIGATANVDLGGYGLIGEYLKLNAVNTQVSEIGKLWWDADNATIDVGLTDNTSLKLGQDVVRFVRNNTGVTINKGTVVYFTGSLGSSGRLTVAPFTANGTVPSYKVVGVITENIPNGEDGYAIYYGKLRNINTSTFADGDELWANPDVVGGITNVKPTAPNNIVFLGLVVHAATNGTIAIKKIQGSSIFIDEGVFINDPQEGDFLGYNATTSLFENRSLSNLAGAGLSLDSSNRVQLGNDGVGVIDFSDTDVFGDGIKIFSDFYDSDIEIRQNISLKEGEFKIENTFNDIPNSIENFAILEINGKISGSTIIIGKGVFNGVQNITFDETINLIKLTDQINFKGLEYDDDYSANWTDHSLVTKKWVTDNFAGSGSAHLPVSINPSTPNGLSIDPTTQVLSIGVASASATGVLSNTDWNTFNGKLNLTSPLTGYTVGPNTPISASDTLIQAFGEIQGQINARVSGTIASGQVAFGTGSGTIGGDSGLTWDNTVKALSIQNYSVTGSSSNSALSISGTWNTTGTPTAISLNVTDTTSNTGSILMSLGVNGNLLYRFRKDSIFSFGPLLIASIRTTLNGSFDIRTQATGTQSDFVFQNGALGSRNHRSGNVFGIESNIGYVPTSGTGQYSAFYYRGVINQTGGASGITRGIHFQPVLTSAADWRSIQWDNNTGWGLYGNGSANNYLGGDLWIRTTSGSNTLDVNGTARIRTVNNLGSAATRFAVLSATGVLSERTAAELASDIGATSLSGLTTNRIIKATSATTVGNTGITEESTISYLFGSRTPSASSTPLSVSFGATVGTNTSGGSGNLKWKLYDDGSSNQYGIGMSSGLMEFVAPSGGGMSFFTNSVRAININSSASVLIGTGNTNLNLQVTGRTNISSANGQMTLSLLSSFSNSIRGSQSSVKLAVYEFPVGSNIYGFGVSSGWLEIITPSGGNIGFYPSGVEVMTLTTAGNMTLRDTTNIILGTTTGTRIGTATNQRLGFWNATPIVQPTTGVAAATLVSNAGTALTSTDTFDGYTLQQIVRALRNTGLLA